MQTRRPFWRLVTWSDLRDGSKARERGKHDIAWLETFLSVLDLNQHSLFQTADAGEQFFNRLGRNVMSVSVRTRALDAAFLRSDERKQGDRPVRYEIL